MRARKQWDEIFQELKFLKILLSRVINSVIISCQSKNKINAYLRNIGAKKTYSSAAPHYKKNFRKFLRLKIIRWNPLPPEEIKTTRKTIITSNH